MKKITFASLLSGVLFLTFACSENTPSETTANEPVEVAEEQNDSLLEAQNAEDEAKKNAEFIVEAANSGMFEVEAAKVAQKKATDKEVKDFAKMMEKDHKMLNDSIKAFATKNNLVLPDSVGEDMKDKIKSLQEKKGKEFDQEYMDMMVETHQKDVEKFQDKLNGTTNPELKSAINSALPVLQKHFQEAQKIDSVLSAKQQNTIKK